MAPKVGDSLPDVSLYRDSPDGEVKVKELCAGKKVVFVGVPGAFTPTCSNTHLPSYKTSYEKFKEGGVDVIAFVSVNDVFVMKAWGEAQGVSGQIDMLADPQCKFSEALGVELDLTAVLGTKRCKRYAMLVEDNVIKGYNEDENPGVAECSMANPVLELLQKMN